MAEGNDKDTDEQGGFTKLMSELKGFLNDESENVQVLDTLTLEGIAKFIKEKKASNIIVMAGAGISTAAGIPDFRSPSTGLYDNLGKYNLPDPMAVFDITYFRQEPRPFFELAKELYPGKFKPTLAHYFIKLLHDEGVLLRHYTQNVDALERVAGVPAKKLVEAHGTFLLSHCVECGAEKSLEYMKTEIFADRVPKCGHKGCTGIVKPDIVFFGESLPERFVKKFTKDFQKCDLLIIMGTSLVVAPFCTLVDRVPKDVPRLYVNRELSKSDSADFFTLLMGGGGGGLRWGEENNYRDVFEQGDCDHGVAKLADLLGWKERLDTLFKTEHARLDEILAKDADLSRLSLDTVTASGTSTSADPTTSTSADTTTSTTADTDTSAKDK